MAMNVNGGDQTRDQLTLGSLLSNVAQIPPWIESLASSYAIPASAQLSINLCLEEVVSNIIRHGYGSQADRSVVVRFSMPRDGYFVFVVDDDAPRFNPLDSVELPTLDPREIRADAHRQSTPHGLLGCGQHNPERVGGQHQFAIVNQFPAMRLARSLPR
jgi:anti-sigma regulatory factor (Ser/Thr protein kinase)